MQKKKKQKERDGEVKKRHDGGENMKRDDCGGQEINQSINK